MYYNLVGALRRRLILELRDAFSQHPVYRKITPYIQNRFSFQERPEVGIVVKGSSANKVQLDPSNFIGNVQSHVMLAQVGQAVFPLEWVKEDLVCVRANAGHMPTPPGVYYLEILSAPQHEGDTGTFIIDPLRTVTEEPVLVFRTGFETEGQLQAEPLAGTLRLYQGRQFLLEEGQDYILNPKGQIRFIQPFPPTTVITADYRYPVESIGPVPFKWNESNTTTLPGVVLAFGKRSEEHQKVAVVVYQDRVDAAQAYGGKFEVSFDLDILARDTIQVEEIADLAYMYLWANKKPILELEGIEIVDISIGGEGEEAIDETGQNFQYTTSISLQLRADWEIHVPLPLTISKITPEPTQVVSDLFYQTRPVLAGRTPDYERIG
jgi:hypothetical protein